MKPRCLIEKSKMPVEIKIKVQPNSPAPFDPIRYPMGSKQEIQQNIDGSISKVYLQKPAIDGKANKELEKFLSKKLNSKVKIIKGLTSKNKTIEIK